MANARCRRAEVASVTRVEKKLPKGLAGAIDHALDGEALLAGAVLEDDAAQQSPAAVLVTPKRLVVVERHTNRWWPLDEVAVTDYQESVPGDSAALAVLAGDEVVKLLVPRDHPHFDLQSVHEQLKELDSPAMAARVAELAWWEGRAAWPYGALGRVAGGTTTLTPGERGTLRLAQTGVYLYLTDRAEPSLQLPWIEVTSITVETPDELGERIGNERVDELGLLAWGLKTTGGACFVTVTTKNEELFYASQAPPAQLREHWSGVLAQFTVDPDEVVTPPAGGADRPPGPSGPSDWPPGPSDLVGKLERLAALHARGALTLEEFTAAKAAVIAGH
jgi:hypothetical protein